jgi:hypothetical protein
LTSVERAAEYSMSGKKTRDPFKDDLRQMETWIFELESLSNKIIERQSFLFYAEEKKRREVSSAPCEANCPLPASKSGFCEEHYEEWRGLNVDRQKFVYYCQQTRSSGGDVLIVEAPWNE